MTISIYKAYIFARFSRIRGHNKALSPDTSQVCLEDLQSPTSQDYRAGKASNHEKSLRDLKERSTILISVKKKTSKKKRKTRLDI
jgi:hypothetical protein